MRQIRLFELRIGMLRTRASRIPAAFLGSDRISSRMRHAAIAEAQC